MSFAAHLLDGFDALGKKTGATLEATAGIGTLFKHLSEVVEEFATKTEGVLHKYASKKLVLLEGSVKTSVETAVKDIETLVSEQHGFAERLVQVSRDIDTFAKEREKQRKKLISDAELLRKDWEAQQSAFRKAKGDYHKLSRDAAQAQQLAAKKEQDPQAKQKDVQSLAQKAALAAEKSKAAEDAYNKALREINEKQRKYYTEEQPNLLGQFQHFEEERVQYSRAQVAKLLELMTGLSLPDKWKALCDSIDAAAKAINVESDIDAYATQLKTNVPVPEAIPFEAPEGGIAPGTPGVSVPPSAVQVSSTPRASGVGAVAAFRAGAGKVQAQQWGLGSADASLSEEEKRKKLTSQSEELDTKVSAMQNQIAATEKLVQMYAKDPQGKKQAEEKLAEDGAALAELKRSRELVQKQLDELSGSSATLATPAVAVTAAATLSPVAAVVNLPMPSEPAPAPPQGEAPHPPTQPEGQKCRAVYDYTAENETELELKEGDTIYVTEKDESGWWYASKGDKQGFIPANYVQPV